MALISEVKCRRCDRRFSGLRARCPYCGTRRSGKGKRVPTGDNTTLKVIIGLLILFILAVAVVFLVVSSNLQNTQDDTTQADTVYSDNEGVSSVDDDSTDTADTTVGTDTADTTATDTSAPAVESVIVKCYSSELSASASTDYNYEFSISIGETVPLTPEITPADNDFTVTWASDDENVAVVLQSGKVTAVGGGDTGLTLTVGDKTVRILVRVS